MQSKTETQITELRGQIEVLQAKIERLEEHMKKKDSIINYALTQLEKLEKQLERERKK